MLVLASALCLLRYCLIQFILQPLLQPLHNLDGFGISISLSALLHQFLDVCLQLLGQLMLVYFLGREMADDFEFPLHALPVSVLLGVSQRLIEEFSLVFDGLALLLVRVLYFLFLQFEQFGEGDAVSFFPFFFVCSTRLVLVNDFAL